METIMNGKLKKYIDDNTKSGKVEGFQPSLEMIIDSYEISLYFQSLSLVSFKPYSSDTVFPIFFPLQSNISFQSFICKWCCKMENGVSIYHYESHEPSGKICRECFGLFFFKFYVNQIMYRKTLTEKTFINYFSINYFSLYNKY
jgi:hypothetical protein